jgi:hypothetical protein
MFVSDCILCLAAPIRYIDNVKSTNKGIAVVDTNIYMITSVWLDRTSWTRVV